MPEPTILRDPLRSLPAQGWEGRRSAPTHVDEVLVATAVARPIGAETMV
jgi:hypothetical protein